MDADWTACINNIAHGVKMRLEMETAYTALLLERTTAIATSLGIPEDSIIEWAYVHCNKADQEITHLCSLLKELEPHMVAGIAVGMTEPYTCRHCDNKCN